MSRRRRFRPLHTPLLVPAFLALAATGCERSGFYLCELKDSNGDCIECSLPDAQEADVETPENTAECELEPALLVGSALGTCVPDIEGGWNTSLVRMVPQDQAKPGCPEDAPFTGLSGEEVPEGGSEPRHVVFCSTPKLSTCCALGWACVIPADGYRACLHQSGAQTCPHPYSVRTLVQTEAGGEETVCCRSLPDPG